MPRPPREKTCRRCRQRRPRRLFPHGGRRCRRCHDAARKSRWHRANRESVAARARRRYQERKAALGADHTHHLRDRNLRFRYGITAGRYDAMLRQQGGRCAICRRDGNGRPLTVDHQHGTSPVLVRALLCSHCNALLGHARESVRTLRAAVSYLKRWRKRRRMS